MTGLINCPDLVAVQLVVTEICAALVQQAQRVLKVVIVPKDRGRSFIAARTAGLGGRHPVPIWSSQFELSPISIDIADARQRIAASRVGRQEVKLNLDRPRSILRIEEGQRTIDRGCFASQRYV